VELLKVLSDIRDCSHIPNGIDKATGQISFETSTGGTVYTPPEECCVKYGYVFAYDTDTSTYRCYQRLEQ
jgi:hypothetical protein